MEMKVKCVYYNGDDGARPCFTVGNVYTWKNNTIEDDSSYVFRASVDGTDPDKWDLSRTYKFKVVDNEKKIVILTNGKDVTARMFEGNTIVKETQAHCHPDDKFDFETGAKIAFDRLVGKVVLEGYKPEEKEEKKFVPHLECAGQFYGEIGKVTNYVDAVGRKLCVGDVVEVFCDGISDGCRAIVEARMLYNCNKVKQFIMGWESKCDDKNGVMKDGLKFVKVQYGSEKKNGSFVDGIEYITEEN